MSIIDLFDTYTITDISKFFEGVSRVSAVSDSGKKVIIDLHNDFFKFYSPRESYIDADFKMHVSQEYLGKEIMDSISYMSTGYAIGPDMVSEYGLLRKYSPDIPFKIGTRIISYIIV